MSKFCFIEYFHFSWYSVMKTNFIKLETVAADEQRRQHMQEEIERMEKGETAQDEKLSENAPNDNK